MERVTGEYGGEGLARWVPGLEVGSEDLDVAVSGEVRSGFGRQATAQLDGQHFQAALGQMGGGLPSTGADFEH